MKTWLAGGSAILLAMIFGIPIAGAQDDAGISDPAFVAASAAPPETIRPADVLKMIDDKRADIALVDTQPPDGYAEQHIPGAINYPWVMQIKNFPIPVPRNKLLIFYGSCPNDTSDMVKKLGEFGYLNIQILDGGIEKWLALKYPVAGTRSGAQPAPEISELTAKPAKNSKPASQ